MSLQNKDVKCKFENQSMLHPYERTYMSLQWKQFWYVKHLGLECVYVSVSGCVCQHADFT